MKKWMLVLVALFVSVSAFSQSCLDDVWQCLRSGQTPKAKKFMESCMSSNPDNAAVWLMQANVNVHLYRYDLEKQQKDPSVAARYPNALEDAYNSFVKALELDPKVEPKTGMLGAIEGQKLLAEPFYEKAAAAASAGKVQDALKYYGLAAKCFELAKMKKNAAIVYLQTAILYNQKLNDKDNYEKMLSKCIETAPDVSEDAYVELYYLYKDKNDTVKCGDVLVKAKKIFADKPEKLYEPEMDYYAMTGNEEKHGAADAWDDASHGSDESGNEDTDVDPPFSGSESGFEIAPAVELSNCAQNSNTCSKNRTCRAARRRYCTSTSRYSKTATRASRWMPACSTPNGRKSGKASWCRPKAAMP